MRGVSNKNVRALQRTKTRKAKAKSKARAEAEAAAANAAQSGQHAAAAAILAAIPEEGANMNANNEGAIPMNENAIQALRRSSRVRKTVNRYANKSTKSRSVKSRSARSATLKTKSRSQKATPKKATYNFGNMLAELEGIQERSAKYQAGRAKSAAAKAAAAENNNM